TGIELRFCPVAEHHDNSEPSCIGPIEPNKNPTPDRSGVLSHAKQRVRASLRLNIPIEHFNLRALVGDFAPEDQAGWTARFDDAPLLADANHAAGQVLRAERFAGGKFRDVLPFAELA